MSVATVRYVHTTVRAALQNAVRKRLIPYNPARDALALKWSDLALPEEAGISGSARIRRRVEHTREQGFVLRENTKTRMRRIVPLFPEVVDALKVHRTRQLEEKSQRSDTWEEHDLVFPNQDGGIMNPNNIRRRHFKPLLVSAGLPDIRLYDLRHSFSTLWVESGEDLSLLQKILGHTSIKTTADVYVHTGDAPRRLAMERFGRNLHPSKDS